MARRSTKKVKIATINIDDGVIANDTMATNTAINPVDTSFDSIAESIDRTTKSAVRTKPNPEIDFGMRLPTSAPTVAPKAQEP